MSKTTDPYNRFIVYGGNDPATSERFSIPAPSSTWYVDSSEAAQFINRLLAKDPMNPKNWMLSSFFTKGLTKDERKTYSSLYLDDAGLVLRGAADTLRINWSNYDMWPVSKMHQAAKEIAESAVYELTNLRTRYSLDVPAATPGKAKVLANFDSIISKLPGYFYDPAEL